MEKSQNALKTLVFIVLIAVGVLHAAPAASQSCGTGDLYIFFGNGVQTSRLQATSNLVALRHVLETRGSLSGLSGKAHFGLSYNIDEFSIIDFLEATGQAEVEWERDLIGWLAGVVEAPEWFLDLFKEYQNQVDETSYLRDDDLRRHVDRYNEVIGQGHRAIVVAHSQGNFYANAAFRLLNSSSFGIVAVASPASRVEGGFGHVTVEGDIILAVPNSLPANVSNGNDNKNAVERHSFVESYLEGSATSGRIVSLVNNLIDGLPAPTSDVLAGAITVRLTWGAQPDVDLHVVEPGGDHVYYRNPVGSQGFLDVDDTDGFGPEHYVVSCGTVGAGTYDIGVNYYSGGSPADALVHISAGNLARSYNRLLPVARGSSGNSSPVPVARVIVTQESSGAFRYQIAERTSFASKLPLFVDENAKDRERKGAKQ